MRCIKIITFASTCTAVFSQGSSHPSPAVAAMNQQCTCSALVACAVLQLHR